MSRRAHLMTILIGVLLAGAAHAQDPPQPQRPAGQQAGGGPGDQGPGARGPGGRPGFAFRMPAFPLLETLDANQDGKLSTEEIDGAAAALKKLDKDNDGKLSAEEIGWPPAGMGRRGRGGPGMGLGGGRSAMGDPAGPPAAELGSDSPPVGFVDRIMNNDKDGDGKVTKEEMPDRMKWMVPRLDTNQDGALDKAEAEAAAAPLSQRKK